MSDTILIIDSREYFNRLIKARLMNYGYNHVYFAETTDEAHEYFYQFQPDVVLVDASLPDCDSYVLAYSFKKQNPSVQVILMFSVEESYDEKRIKESQVDGVAIKTLDCRHLVTVIKKSLFYPAKFSCLQ